MGTLIVPVLTSLRRLSAPYLRLRAGPVRNVSRGTVWTTFAAGFRAIRGGYTRSSRPSASSSGSSGHHLHQRPPRHPRRHRPRRPRAEHPGRRRLSRPPPCSGRLRHAVFGFTQGLIWAFVGGLTANLLVAAPLGSSRWRLLLVTAVVSGGGLLLGRLVWVYPMPAALIASLLADVIALLVSQLVGDPINLAVPLTSSCRPACSTPPSPASSCPSPAWRRTGSGCSRSGQHGKDGRWLTSTKGASTVLGPARASSPSEWPRS